MVDRKHYGKPYRVAVVLNIFYPKIIQLKHIVSSSLNRLSVQISNHLEKINRHKPALKIPQLLQLVHFHP